MIKKLFFVAICCILTALFFLLSEKESTHAADQAQANETSQPSLPANNAAEPRNREASAATAATTFNSTAPTANVREKFPQRLIKPQIEEVDFSAIEAFSQWTKEWKKASPQERRVLETKGVELAIARRAHFKTLIQANPELALKNAVPIVDRQELPEPIIAQLEKRVSASGDYRVMFRMPQEGEARLPNEVFSQPMFASADGELSLFANVYGTRIDDHFLREAKVWGVAIDRQFAVAESPLRPLEDGERIAANVEKQDWCPVSEKSTAKAAANATYSAEEPAVEVAGKIVYLCDGSHTVIYEQAVIAGQGGPAGSQNIITTGIGVKGNLRVLFIRAAFPDHMREPGSRTACEELMHKADKYYQENSYGKLSMTWAVTPTIVMPHTSTWYLAKDAEVDGLGLMQSHGREEARRLGYDSANYDCIVMRYSGGVTRGAGGWGGGDSVWVFDEGLAVLIHEIGHSLGLAHANFWDTSGQSAIGTGANQEYGHQFDVMGNAYGVNEKGHYNTFAKNKLKWLTARNIYTEPQSGLYRIHAFDQPALDLNNRYAIKLQKDTSRHYWLDYRVNSISSHQPWSLGIQWGAWTGIAGNALQIDTTPGSPDSKNDAGVVVGRTFSDYEAGLHITPLARNTTTPPSLDVMIQKGDFASNQAPTLALTASSLFVPTGASVTYTATASDPDGDTLAYSWDFGDGSESLNQSVVSKTYASATQRTIICRVSDMKGKTAVRTVTITAGNPTVYQISGRVTNGSTGVADVLISNGAGKITYSDSDGFYNLANLSAGTYTLSALSYGYSFSNTFSNPLSVGPSQVNANFTASQVPRLTIATTNGTEGGTAGKFTITRTGVTTSALVVRTMVVRGTATKGTDYNFSPDYITNSVYQNFTIPAGAASLDVTTNITNDTSAEGPETIVLELANDSSYLIAGNGVTTQVINDNDTSLPKISIACFDDFAQEAGGSATWTVTRTGVTTSPLAVNFAISGNAGNGSDYATISPSVTIPAGASSATVALTPINDSLTEIIEDVKLTLSTNAAYLIDSTANNATASIMDDDIAVVSIEAADANAAEASLDQGIFVIRRTGSTNDPLTIFYSVAGRAVHGQDYEVLPGAVTIPAGQSAASVVITPYDDAHGEVAEPVVLQIGSSSNGIYQVGTANKATVTIADNDGTRAHVGIGVNDGSIAEGNNGSFQLRVTSPTAGTVAVKYTISGTATNGTDYTSISGTTNVTTTAGALTTVAVPITVTDDALLENAETIIVTLTPDPAYVFYGDDTATLYIRDNDGSNVIVGVDAYNSSPKEGSANGKFWFYRRNKDFTALTTGALTVNYAVTGTATNGVDFTTLPGTVVIPDGADGVNVDLAVTNDTAQEGFENVSVQVTAAAASEYSIGINNATLWIEDNETMPLGVQFAQSGSRVLESPDASAASGEEQYRNITVNLSGVSASPVTVEVYANSGSSNMTNVNSTGLAVPYWVRLVRSGESISSFRSADGSTWTQVGTTQTIPMGQKAYVGLFSCALNNAALCTATFTNVNITGATGVWKNQDIGAVGIAGSYSQSAGTFTVNGSGTDVWNSTDEFHYVYQEIEGDTTITARVTSQTNTSTSAKAGVMIRSTLYPRTPQAFTCVSPSNSVAFQYRPTTATGALADMVDYGLLDEMNVAQKTLTLSFAPGETSKTFRISVIDDNIIESTEYATLSLRRVTGAGFGTRTSHALAISDNSTVNPLPKIEFAKAATSSAEYAPAADLLVTLNRQMDQAISVNYAVTAGTATAESDYTLTSGTLTFAPGDTALVIPHSIVNDLLEETAETLAVTLTAPTGATLGAKSLHTLTVLDDDFPVLSVIANDNSATENSDPGQFTITRAGATAAPLTVNFTASGSATSGVDYSSLGTSVTIPAGETSTQVPINSLNDATLESTETIILTLTANAAYSIGSPSSATVNLLDDDSPVVSITIADGTATEAGVGTGILTVSRVGSTTNALTVNFTTSGSATSGSDFVSIGSNITIPAGASSANITITPIDDLLQEGDEFILVTLSSSASYTLSSASYAGASIEDNDVAPVVTILSPFAQTAVLPSAPAILLEATATDDGLPNPLLTQWSKVSGPGTVTFTSASSTTTGATFSAGGRYVLRLSATDGSLSTARDVVVHVGGTDALIGRDVGTLGVSGTYTENAGAHTLTARTGDLWGTADNVFTTFQAHSGDCTISARVVSISGTTASWSKAGVQIRSTTEPNAKHASAVMTPSNGMAYQYRSSTGGSTTNSNTAALTAPYWIRLVKTGDLISAFRSADGITWTQEGTAQTITMPSQYFIGFTLCSNTSSGTASVTFDNLTVTSTAANKAPLVAVGADQSVTSLIANLTSVTSDDNLPNLPANVSYTWQQLSGPGTATFATPNAAQSEVLFSTDGTYALRLLADDGFVKTYDDLNVSASSQTVTLTAADSIISETGSNPASCTFNRLTNLGDLTVNYTITGTATAADYATLTGSIIIPDGQTSATLSILPINDTLLEGPETLEITINSGGYLIGSPDTVNFTIEDDDSPPIVNITSPTASTVAIPAAVGIILAAEVNDDGTPTPAVLTQEWSKVSGPGSVTFETPNLPASTALFSSSGTYVLRLTASDGQQSTSDDVTVHVNVPTVFSPTWQDLGSPNPPGTQSFNAPTGTYTIAVGGRAFSTQTNDVGSFGSMPFVGDFEMIAKVTCNDAQGSTSERVGLAIRQGTNSGTAQAFIGTSFTNYIWATRATNDGAGTVTQNPWASGDRWVRLVRTGSSVTGFISTNGTTWTQSGTINLTLSNPVYVGIGAASGSVNNTVIGTVSSASFVSSSANVGALVNAGPDQTIQLPQSATLAGSSSDDALPSNPGTHTLTWSKIAGPSSVEFSDASSATSTASFSAVGTYSLRLIAHDSEVQTFDDMIVTATATPIQAWRDDHFSMITNPQDAENLADPDNDSIPNLLEYAFGTDPTIANANGGPTADTVELNGEKHLQLNVTKNPNATDLIYQVEFSTDMLHWSSAGNIIITNTPTLLEVRSPANSIKKYGRAVITNP
ncbi:MAG: hypothetical protein B9S37_04500 [Verrucomicrobiia bacterium Tous-C3TDCM]|nr:MAG: hypothetical protein B9S37_04500 [Verrucomicrobiae bacterium Tous-C3TDCM]PAZ06782.1 MAG: hypothetical protein CAK88_02460 [Verrucomicrobiae bacterium AMD-G2]